MEKNLFYVIIRLPGLNSSNTSPSTSQTVSDIKSEAHLCEPVYECSLGLWIQETLN